jgi:trk system potassium uptake protein TrkA
MSKMNHQVTVIDRNKSAFDNLPLDFQGRTIEGDVLTQNVLHRAEVEGADALAAVTTLDSLNALVAHIARTEYQITKVVARNHDPRQRPLQEAFGVPVVGFANLGARRIIRLFSDAPLRQIHMDASTNFLIYQLEVPKSWNRRPLQDLLPEAESKVLALMRDGQPVPVAADQSLETGDLIYISTDSEGSKALQDRLDVRQEELL